MSIVRTRIAPSPSGFLHIGTAKTALYNWLMAKKSGGSFVLRLEDTDAERTDEAYVEAMCEGFRWLGITWDEGPAFGGEPEKGPSAPYRQSQRRELHREAAMRLLEEGKAYKCFCSREELDAERARRQAEKAPLQYSRKCRDLTPGQIDAMGAKSYVVRFNVPEGETLIHDLIQGDVRIDNAQFEDFVLLKSGGYPMFHLAVVVDDAAMGITHVIRGDDHLTNTGRHIMLFEALGYDVPIYAHHPLVHDEHGKKYSKRLHGANVLDWRDDGYLPETLINYVVLLGWTSEEKNRELFTLDELVETFDIARVGKAPSRFDRKKLDWLNGQRIRLMSDEDLRDRIVPVLEKAGLDTSQRSAAWLCQLAGICKEKLPTLNDIVKQADFFFQELGDYEEKGVKKQFAKADSLQWLEAARRAMEAAASWDHDGIKAAYQDEAGRSGFGLGKLVNPTRLALTGKTVGPGLFELAELTGKAESLARMDRALAVVRDMEGVAP